MRALLILLSVFICSECLAQGQATLPDALKADDKAKAQGTQKSPGEEKSEDKAKAGSANAVKPKLSQQGKAVQKGAEPLPPYLDRGKYVQLYNAQFSQGVNEWFVANQPEVESYWLNGMYVVEHKRPTGGWMFRKNINFNPRDNFVLEIEGVFLKHAPEGWIGLIVGLQKTGDSLKYQRFSLYEDGYFSFCDMVKIGSNDSSPSFCYASKTRADSFKSGMNAVNKMKMIHYGGVCYLFVNDSPVAKFKYNPPPGDICGLSVGGKRAVGFKSISLYKIM